MKHLSEHLLDILQRITKDSDAFIKNHKNDFPRKVYSNILKLLSNEDLSEAEDVSFLHVMVSKNHDTKTSYAWGTRLSETTFGATLKIVFDDDTIVKYDKFFFDVKDMMDEYKRKGDIVMYDMPKIKYDNVIDNPFIEVNLISNIEQSFISVLSSLITTAMIDKVIK